MSAVPFNLILRYAGNVPFPVFGTVATLTQWARYSTRKVAPALGWAFPIAVGGLWFVWPAVHPEWKMEMGITKPEITSDEIKQLSLTLDDDAKWAIANAHKMPEDFKPNAKDLQVQKEARRGITTTLENEWDTFLAKAIKPGEDDDDDDDDEDDEDEEEDEEEGDEDEDDDEE